MGLIEFRIATSKDPYLTGWLSTTCAASGTVSIQIISRRLRIWKTFVEALAQLGAWPAIHSASTGMTLTVSEGMERDVAEPA